VPRTTDTKSSQTLPDWDLLAEGIRQNDEVAVQQFYDVFNNGFRYLIQRQLGPDDLEDSVHDCILAVITAVRRGTLQKTERFAGFVQTIVKRHIISKIDEKISDRKNDTFDSISPIHFKGASPEAQALKSETKLIARHALDSLSDRDRDVLRRFYLLDQTEEQIRRDLNLSPHVFKNIKHRAKNKFAEQWHSRAGRRVTGTVPVGNSKIAA